MANAASRLEKFLNRKTHSQVVLHKDCSTYHQRVKQVPPWKVTCFLKEYVRDLFQMAYFYHRLRIPFEELVAFNFFLYSLALVKLHMLHRKKATPIHNCLGILSNLFKSRNILMKRKVLLIFLLKHEIYLNLIRWKNKL